MDKPNLLHWMEWEIDIKNGMLCMETSIFRLSRNSNGQLAFSNQVGFMGSLDD